MDTVYRKFYRGMYLNTGGFIPSEPINQNFYPGDFFQIRNGEIIVLGNIFRKCIIDPDVVEIEYDVKLNPANWTFGEGVTKPYCGRGTGNNAMESEFEFSKQILAFKNHGSYFFKGVEPRAVKILNWTDIWQQLIIKLTQTFYSFREIYVVTECATMANWTLAISSSKKAELEIATDSENFGLVDLFGHASSRTVQSKDIEYYHRQNMRKPTFFKAKKLVVQNEKLDVFISELINERLCQNEWANDFFQCNFDNEPYNYTPRISGNAQVGVLDMLQANELNPNTALLYFRWEDANLDDVEKLFLTYGD